MNEEQLNNIDKPEFPSPIQGWKPTAHEAIQAINRLLWSDGVEGDDHEEAKTIKAFLVDTLPNTVVTPNMSKSTPVMETTIEAAQKHVADFTKFWFGNADFRCWEKDNDLEYIEIFIDTIADEMAAMSSAYDSMHDRYVQALATIEEWKDNFEARNLAATRHLEEKIELQKEVDRLKAQAKIDKATINASLSSINAAHDNR